MLCLLTNTIQLIHARHTHPHPTKHSLHVIRRRPYNTLTIHETVATQLQDYIHTLEQWFTNNRMKVSTNKSSLTLITPHNVKYRTQVTTNNTPLPVTHSTKILGVTFDREMTFKQHTDDINTKAKNRLNVIRSFTHTTYRHSKKDITKIYKHYIRPILT